MELRVLSLTPDFTKIPSIHSRPSPYHSQLSSLRRSLIRYSSKQHSPKHLPEVAFSITTIPKYFQVGSVIKVIPNQAKNNYNSPINLKQKLASTHSGESYKTPSKISAGHTLNMRNQLTYYKISHKLSPIPIAATTQATFSLSIKGSQISSSPYPT